MFRPMARTCCFIALLGLFALATPFSNVHAFSYKIEGIGTFEGNVLSIAEPFCPFGATADAGTLEQYKQATKDSDGCPYATVIYPADLGSGNATKKQPLAGCGPFYESLSVYDTNLFDQLKLNKAKIATCNLPGPPSTARIDRLAEIQGNNNSMRQVGSQMALTTGTLVPKLLNVEQKKEIEAEKKAEIEAKDKCFSDSLSKIGAYWGKQNAVSCIQNGAGQVQKYYKQAKQEVEATIEVCQGHGSDFTIGFSGAPLAIANLIACIINVAVTAATVATKVKDLSDWVNSGCQKESEKIENTDKWRIAQLNSICKAAESFVERQFTQCIRVNVGMDLSLPKFKILLQCPFNLNLSVRLTNSGFKTTCMLNSNNAITGHQTLGSANGGLESLFNGSCFSKAEVETASGEPFKGLEDVAEAPLPGVECGTLSQDPARNNLITGVKPLQSGVIANGWVAGPGAAGTETVNGVQITRCDKFADGRRVTTTYVYGNGASCSNSPSSGFKDAAGMETNTACYGSGGYLPASAPVVPDACLYPKECLDAAGAFLPGKVGSSTACPANIQPNFCGGKAGDACPECVGAACPPMQSYMEKTSGVGATPVWKACTGLDVSVFDPAPVCCDPQKQNCVETMNDARREGRAEIPLCKCTEGDANNKPDPNKQDGSCLQAGYATCCASSLNKVMDAAGNIVKDATGKDLDGCTVAPSLTADGKYNNGGLGLATSAVCQGEAPSCLSQGECGTYKAADGSTQSLCPNQIAISKPSPYLYLFVRPDATIPNNPDGSFNPNAVQCCMTKWCNICPQHYVNAYGLSLARSEKVAPVPYGRYQQSNYDQNNDAIVGDGWPYVGVEDQYGSVTYKVGRDALNYAVSVYYDWSGGNGKDGSGPLTFFNPESGRGASRPHKNNNWYLPVHLQITDEIEDKWLGPQFTACNNLGGTAGKWQASYTTTEQLGEGVFFGMTYKDRQGNDGGGAWKTVFPVPEPSEYPMDYYNRVVGAGQGSTIMGKSVPSAPPLQLCAEVIKVCEPSVGNALTGDSAINTGGSDIPAGGCNAAGVCDTSGDTDVPDDTTGGTTGGDTGGSTGGGGGGGDVRDDQAQSARTAAPAAAATTTTTSPGPTSVPSVPTGGGTTGSGGDSLQNLY